MVFLLRNLSPRRRLFVLGAMAVVLALLAFVGVRAVVDAVRAPGAPPQDRPGPVLLIPGFGGEANGLRPLVTRLSETGREVVVVQLPGDGTGDLVAQAEVVDSQVTEALADGGPSVDIVGYSAGGITARVWADRHDGRARARRIVTLGSPHHGADIAAAGSALAAGACPPACRQVAPGNPLLASLGDTAPSRPVFTSLWTTFDQTVTPPETSRLTGAVNIPLQSVCSDARTSHSGLPSDPLVIGLVVRALAPAPFSAPGPADCAALRAE